MDTLFKSACNDYKVPPTVIDKWLDKLKEKYGESHRYYHNEENMFSRKIHFLQNSSNYVIFATIFQYYEFDSKKNCVEKNCDAFKEFIQDAGINDVSTYVLLLKSNYSQLI